MQKKQRKLIISILVCVCYLCAIYACKTEAFASEKGSERFNNEFIANANLQIKDDNIVILSETSLLETMESGEKRYVEDRLVLLAENEEEQEALKNDVLKFRSGKKSSGGSSYKYKWDSSGTLKAYTRVYYNVSAYAGDDYYKITSVTGGYSYPGGSNGVSVKSQSLTFGQTGASKQGGIVTQNSTVNISSSSWSKTPPSSWVEVNESKTPCLVGANYILKLKRGTSSSTWTVELTNNIVYNPL